MAKQALFAGLVTDRSGGPVDVAYIGGEPFYVVDDNGFKRHIESEFVDRQVLDHFADFIRGHEDLISEGTMQAIGQADIFTKAIIDKSLENLDKQFDNLIESGLPEDVRAWMGMLGFRVSIDLHGNVVEIVQPAGPPEESD
jgi:hypothetical protein